MRINILHHIIRNIVSASKRRSVVIRSQIAGRLERLMREDEDVEDVIVRILDHYETCPRESCPRKG